MNPAIDVIVPCHNYGRYLRQCARSVLQETDLPIRLLIIDDASTDSSAGEARGIADEDSRVAVVVHGENQGHIATYNEGLAWVQAPYLLLLSADDMVAPGALARAVALMEACPRVALVYGEAARFTDVGDIPALPEAADHKAARVQPGREFIRRICERPENPVETATAVVRTAVQRKVGGYRPELPHAGDLEMWLRCAAQGDLGFVPQIQAFTRIHGTNMRHDYSGERVLSDYRQRVRAFELFFSASRGQLPGAGRLERVARRALAEEALWAAARALEESGSPAASELAQLAWEIDRSIPCTALWWKAMAKRAMGRRLRQVLAKAVA